ncbi:MAG: class I SAM-dependent methyltransferase [Anaerolineales bacterium]
MSPKRRKEKIVERLLREVGIEEGHTVLDCCCGAGVYTLPAAEIVGEEGSVYAIDRNSRRISDLRKKVDARGLHNVKIIEGDITAAGCLSETRFDVVLLYDIFWYFRPEERRTEDLLKKIGGLVKEDGLISVYPTHTTARGTERFKDEMRAVGFVLESECPGQMVHEGRLERGRVLNFRKT